MPKQRFTASLSRRSILAAACLLLSIPATSALAQESTLPISLQRGINLSHWFAQSDTYSPDHLRTHTTPSDIALIDSLGFDHVRFTLEPAILWNERDPGRLNADPLRLFDDALDMILDTDLNIVVDLHPSDDFKFPLRDNDEYIDAFAAFWTALAEHLADRGPERVALEVINEPRVEDPDRWQAVIERLVAAIRDAAPDHTIIVCGPKWSGVDDLLKLHPLDDPNILYTFHMYDPFAFTHQGASWAGEEWEALRDVPYPSTPGAVAAPAERIDHEQARRNLEWYGQERWNADRIADRVGKAAAWGEEHNVPLYCGEFGAYKRTTDPEARARFLHDARTAFEQHDIGWAMWDYKGGFTVLDKSAAGDKPQPDPSIIEALGLN